MAPFYDIGGIELTNKDLANLVDNTIKETGVTKMHIANKLGISRQAFDKLLDKKQFSVDDANKILNIIGYNIENVVMQKI